MKILFYTPLNTRCRDIESQAIEFRKKAHEIFLLTQTERYELHENFKSYGFSAFARPRQSRSLYWLILLRMFDLAVFCYRYRIDVVYSHLEPCNFVAVLTRLLMPSRVIICRHHVDEAKLYGFETDLSYKITYRFASEIIVVSQRAKDYMVAHEKVPASKIHHVKLAYHFDLYDLPDMEKVRSIRKQHPEKVLLLSVCRLTEYKRPGLAIQTLAKLRAAGVDAKLIILGKGHLENELQDEINRLSVRGKVLMPGYVNNVLEYMAAADLLIHPSLLESSCISLKEAGLVKLPTVVCSGVGDFDEVISHKINGFLVNPDRFVVEAVDIVTEYSDQSDKLKQIGEALSKTIYDEFDIRNVAPYYEANFNRRKPIK